MVYSTSTKLLNKSVSCRPVCKVQTKTKYHKKISNGNVLIVKGDPHTDTDRLGNISINRSLTLMGDPHTDTDRLGNISINRRLNVMFNRYIFRSGTLD